MATVRCLRPHTCKYCDRCFDSFSDLVTHRNRRHQKLYQYHWIHNKKPYMCGVCGLKFWSSPEMTNHVEANHIKVTVKPTEMGFQTTNSNKEIIDFKTCAKDSDKGKPKYQCGKCSVTVQKTCIKQHALIHMALKKYVCSVCGNAFKNAYNLKVHGRIHKQEKPYECKICQMCFTTNSTLKLHLRLHTGERPYTCGSCPKTFRHISSMRAHEKIHVGDKPFICTECGKDFYTQGFLNKHMKFHPKWKHFMCGKCCRVFKNKNDRDVHEAGHPNEKMVFFPRGNYVCEVCDKSFELHSALRVHMSSRHSMNRPYKCSLCDRRFLYSSAMKNHENLVHSNKRQFKCEVCGQMFKGKYAYQEHLKIHSGVKEFECSTCERKFTTKSGLTYHQRTHTGVRLFTCEICGKGLTSSSSFHRHKETHENKTYSCDICGHATKHKKNLRLHMMKHNEKDLLVQCVSCVMKGNESDEPGKELWKYQCKLCAKSFSQKTRFYTHVSKHETQGPFQCQTCGDHFTASSLLPPILASS